MPDMRRPGLIKAFPRTGAKIGKITQKGDTEMINRGDFRTQLKQLVRKGVEARGAKNWALSARFFEAAYTLSRDPIWRYRAIEMDEVNLKERVQSL